MPEDDLLNDPLLEEVPLHEGYKVLGGVVLFDRLGEGGMGVVYHGKHLRLNIDVAVKVLLPPRVVSAKKAEEHVKRFIREAQTAASIHHTNLVRVYDVNSEFGIHYLVMDFIDGESAAERLRRKGSLSVQEAVEIVLATADGVAEAHRARIVHRDVKPDNIMIDKSGRIRLTDLGLAKHLEPAIENGEDSHITDARFGLGTPHYMPPEQFTMAGTVGPQADVWSLGVTLFRLLSGSLPWRDASMHALARKIMEAPIPDIRSLRPGVSAELHAIIGKATAKFPGNRYASAAEIAEVLRAHSHTLATARTSVLPDEDAGKATTRRKVAHPPIKAITALTMQEETKRAPPSAARLAEGAARRAASLRRTLEGRRSSRARGSWYGEDVGLRMVDIDLAVARSLEHVAPDGAMHRLQRAEMILQALDARLKLVTVAGGARDLVDREFIEADSELNAGRYEQGLLVYRKGISWIKDTHRLAAVGNDGWLERFGRRHAWELAALTATVGIVVAYLVLRMLMG